MSQEAQPQPHLPKQAPHSHPGDEDFEPPPTGTVEDPDTTTIIKDPPGYGDPGEEG